MTEYDTQTTEPPTALAWSRLDRFSLRAILGGGIIVAALIAVAGCSSIIGELASGHRSVRLIADRPLPAAADAGAATILDGRYDTALVTVGDLAPVSAGLLTAGSIIMLVSQLLVAASFVYLAWRLLRREPFLRSLTWAFIGAGAVLLVGTLVGGSLRGFGGWLVAAELGGNADDDSFWPLAMSLDLGPVGLAFVLMLVGCAFEYAQKLSRETAGLV